MIHYSCPLPPSQVDLYEKPMVLDDGSKSNSQCSHGFLHVGANLLPTSEVAAAGEGKGH